MRRAKICAVVGLALAFRLGTLPAEPPAAAEHTVRIGVLNLFRPAELVLGPVQAGRLVLEVDGRKISLEGAQKATLRAAGGAMTLEVGNQRTPVRSIQMAQSVNGFWLAVPGKLERRFQGRLTVANSGNQLAAVIEMGLETAVASIVAAESVPGATAAALRAQAVATRSFLVGAKRDHDGFDFCDTTHCQFLRSPPSPQDASYEAAAATEGIVLAYQGTVVAALFSRSCGGTTRSLAEIGMAEDRYPFFPVNCLPCRRSPEQWQRRLPLSQAARILAEGATEAVRIEIARRLGWQAIPSNNYSIVREGDSVSLSGTGIGHGAGLCQTGAARLGAFGWDFQTILKHYFPNTTLQGESLTAQLRPRAQTR